MARDAVDAPARDQLGISNLRKARPLQAKLTSAATFTAGAAVPLASAVLARAFSRCRSCCRILGLSCVARRDWRHGGGCQNRSTSAAVAIVGRIGNGPDRGHRSDRWHCRPTDIT